MKNLGIILRKLAKTNKISMLGDFNRKKYNPWKILIGTILSARCTDEVTMPTSEKLFKKYPAAKNLAKANPKDVQKIIKPIGFYKNKTKYIIEASKKVVENKNKVPKNTESLLEIPGVGRKVAGCVLVYAYDLPSIPVDTHVAVISKRLGWTEYTNPDKIMDDLEKKIPKRYWHLINELLVLHGKNICFKRNPRCNICPITKYCNYYKDMYLKKH